MMVAGRPVAHTGRSPRPLYPRVGCRQAVGPVLGWVMTWLLLAGCLAAPPVMAQDDAAREQLQRMEDAMRSLSYEGVFVYTQGERAETMRVVHSLIDGESHERVTALTGPALELIRQGDHVVCLLPDKNRAIVGHLPRGLLPGALADGLQEAPEHYRVVMGSDNRVAGRTAREIRLEPVDGYRYAIRLWVDREHALLLRSELRDGDGAVIERLMFTAIDVGNPVDGSHFAYSLDDFTRVDRVMQASGEVDEAVPAWVESALPPGYSRIAMDTVEGHGEGGGWQHAVYSDGVASISLFVDEISGGDGFPARADRGALRVRSRQVAGRRVTLLGVVPEAALEFMLDTLEETSGAEDLEAEG